MRSVVALALVLLASLSVFGCSQRDAGENPGGPGTSREFTEGTLASADAPAETTGRTVEKTVKDAGGDSGDEPGSRSGDAPEGTVGAARPRPDAVLRVEGSEGTTFSGICTVGRRDNVLSSRVPKRYSFDLDGQQLSCRIQKRDPGEGKLRVVLLAGDSTRSVQQTTARDGVINVSYGGA